MGKTSLILAALLCVCARAETDSVSDKATACETALTPTHRQDPDRDRRRAALAAIQPFSEYFAAINSNLYEREFLTRIAKLALISEEHVLLMGPPGNAKSLFVDVLLSNIRDSSDQKSYYRIQMTPETTQSETHGPLNFKALNETGRYERLLSEGMLLSRNVFIDEIFDSRANALRNILGMLNERAHAQGIHITEGKIETAFAATNRYISEVYEKSGDDSPKAVLDRFAFSAFVPGEFESPRSYRSLIQGQKAKQVPVPHLQFDNLAKLRDLLPQVEIPDVIADFMAVLSAKVKSETESLEQSSLRNYKEKLRNGEEPGIPYRSTKYHSPRTLGKAAKVLRALVVADWIEKKGKRRLTATIDDVAKLESFFTLNGPSSRYIEHAIESTSNPHERAQMMAIIQERGIFKTHFVDITQQIDAVVVEMALHEMQTAIAMASSEKDKAAIAKKIVSLIMKLDSEMPLNRFHSELSGRDIGLAIVKDHYVNALANVLGKQGADIAAELDRERQKIEQARLAKIEAERADEERLVREEQAKIAAEKAREAAEIARQARKIEEIVGNVKDQKVIFTSGKYENLDSVTTVISDVTTKRLAYIDPSEDFLAIISYGNLLKISEKIVDIKFGAHASLTIKEGHFLSDGQLLLISESNDLAVVVDIETGELEEIQLGQGIVQLAGFEPKSKKLYTLSNQGELRTLSLSSPSVKKTAITFKKTEAGNKFQSLITGRRESLDTYKFSSDGKYLTFAEHYGSHQFVLELKTGVVIEDSTLLPGRRNSSISGRGHFGVIESAVILDREKKGAVSFFAADLSEAGDNVSAALTSGIAQVDDGPFYIGFAGSEGSQLFELKSDKLLPREYKSIIEDDDVCSPVYLGGGLMAIIETSSSTVKIYRSAKSK